MGCVVIDFRFVVNIEPLKHRLMMLTINVKCTFWTGHLIETEKDRKEDSERKEERKREINKEK